MRISANKLIGSLVYKTRQALRSDQSFISGLNKYYYRDSCFLDGEFSYWHYPGTPNEIASALRKISESPKGSSLRYPSVFNFQPIRQRIEANATYHYNLAFVAPTKSEWLTQQREEEVFQCVLRPIYNEFFNQIEKSKYFNIGFGDIPHDYYEVFTTGNNQDELIKGRYGDFIDAIEIHNLPLTLKNLCDRDIQLIEKENSLVTEQII